MGFFNKDKDSVIKTQTFEWDSSTKGENVMFKQPRNIYLNDNVIVHEDEFALFFRDGKVMHVFDRPGRFALTTQNVPILTTILKSITGVQQLGEVYFVQRRELRGKFGTKEPITFRDTDFGMVRIRIFGQFSYKVLDPTLFITQFAGTKAYGTSDEVIDWMRDQIIMSLNDMLGELKRDKNMAVIDMPAYLEEMEQILLSRIKDDAARYGLQVLKITGLNINLPENVQQAIDKRGEMSALGVNYMQYQTGKAMEKAAENPSGGNLAGMGVGLGAGMGMGYGMTGAMAQGMTQAPPPMAAPPQDKCPKCGTMVNVGVKFCNNCGEKMGAKGGSCFKCGAALTPGSKFCNECGSKQVTECPKCKAALTAGTKFCNECGEKIA